MQLRRLSIIGVGLLGGSIGLAVRSKLKGCKILGYGHRPETLRRAEEIGAIDEGFDHLPKAVEGADLVILCTPVGLFGQMLRGMAKSLKNGVLVTDVGSTKRSVVQQAQQLLPASATFVGSHPMAGSEKRGVEYARTDLFHHSLCIVTPTPSTPPAAAGQIETFWQALGMRTYRMDAAEHDAAVAAVSHLPHAVAAALVSMQKDAALRLSGKGFLDSTRIAGGDGGLWRDIFLDNADNLRQSLKQLRKTLEQFEKLLTPEKGEELRQWLDAAAARRDALVEQKLREITPD